MKPLIAAFASLALVGPALAEDALVDGGLSPDGLFEVRIAKNANGDLSDYSVQIHAAKAKEPFYTLGGGGGWEKYPAASQDCHALWHPSSRYVVITDRGTRHSREIYLLEVSSDHVERLPLPDYIQNALGRVNATEVDLHCISTPQRWAGDDLILTFYFSTSTPDGHRRFYTCDVTLHLSPGPNRHSSVRFVRVTQPKENEG